MKHIKRITAFTAALVLLLSVFAPTASAADFSGLSDLTNIGVNTQYSYTENNPSWLRQLTVKEDMLSAEGIANEAVLYPVTDYPYRTDAASFKKEVADYTKTFTLDKDSQKAAYLYMLKQLGALTIISEPTVDDQTKVDWLRDHGIAITKEEENDPESQLMISALYALMRNDIYYVIKGEKLDIPEGTPLEEAVMIYLMALSGQRTTLISFIQKYFGSSSIGSLDDYVYYTSLMALYTNGYISISEIGKLSRDEVYRRVAIMTIQNYGISIDAETATTEEIQIKYLAAMLGEQYKVTLDPDSLQKSSSNNAIAYYILQRMAYEDAKIAITLSKYSYEQAFKLVIKNTHRFDLENQFYSDIHEYNVYLKNIRDHIYINPNPISQSGATVYLDGTEVTAAEYATAALKGTKVQTVTLVSRYSYGGTTKNSYYKLNIYEGSTPASGSDITGLISNIATGSVGTLPASVPKGTLGYIDPSISYYNGVLSTAVGIASKVLHLNDKGQLVDADGNIVNATPVETLADGYKYVVDENGIISIALISEEETTAEKTASGTTDTKNTDMWRNIIIGCSIFLLVALIVILVVVLRITSQKKNTKSKSDGGAKKAKEKQKQAKKEARKSKKSTRKK